MKPRSAPFCSRARLLAGVLGLGVVTNPVLAQNKPAPANLLEPNAGFEVSTPEENLWDGVARDNGLAARSFSVQALGENGFRNVAMPPSVALADLNGDGKPDLVTADPHGFFYFYENVGTATEPRFTSAELIPIFLSAVPRRNPADTKPDDRLRHARTVPRFALADWRRRGTLDLLVGNFAGELFFLPNAGSAKAPAFRQPRPVEAALLRPAGGRQLLPVAANLLRPAGGRQLLPVAANLLAPAVGPWTGPGRADLILGEGTYSANAVRLLENVGSGGVPQFSQDRVWDLAYGDGKELLLPTVVDYDGDGRPDLLVADRTGTVSVFLNPGANWKPGQELPFVSKVTFGGSDKLPGLSSLHAADFNGDGLFDLLIGLPNGRLAVALNTGARGQPRFGPWQELKGQKRLPATQVPAGWKLDTHFDAGNHLAVLHTVSVKDDPESKPPEGVACLRAGYWPVLGHVFPSPFESIPAEARHFEFSHPVSLQLGKTYLLSFKVKGAGAEKPHFAINPDLRFAVETTVKIERGERGSVRKIYDQGTADPYLNINGEFPVGREWATVQRPIVFQTRGRDLPEGTRVNTDLRIFFEANRADAAVYFDDFHLVEQGR